MNNKKSPPSCLKNLGKKVSKKSVKYNLGHPKFWLKPKF